MPPSNQLESQTFLAKKFQSSHFFMEWIPPAAGHLHVVDKVLADQQTSYQKVQIFQTERFGKILILDGDPQSSERDEEIYHEVLVHPAMVTHPSPKKVLILGGGEGATLREVLRHPSVEKAFMVDIDADVVDLCKKELPSYSQGAFDDKRTQLIIGDANKFLQETREKFDVVISDLTLPYPDSPSEGLVTEPFFRFIKAALKPDGIFAMQASGTDRGMNSLYLHNVALLRKIWKTARPCHAFVPFFYSDWGFIVASDQHDPLKVSREAIDQRLGPFASKLNYYDGLMHGALFTLSKELRNA